VLDLAGKGSLEIDKEACTHVRVGQHKSALSTYGIIAMGKRLTKFIDSFKTAFDLKTIGRNKFSVSFSEGTTANKFIEYFNNISSKIFPGEKWIAVIPNFKV